MDETPSHGDGTNCGRRQPGVNVTLHRSRRGHSMDSYLVGGHFRAEGGVKVGVLGLLWVEGKSVMGRTARIARIYRRASPAEGWATQANVIALHHGLSRSEEYCRTARVQGNPPATMSRSSHPPIGTSQYGNSLALPKHARSRRRAKCAGTTEASRTFRHTSVDRDTHPTVTQTGGEAVRSD